MPVVSRTGVSLEQSLLDDFDRLIAKRGYRNRSEALRDLIREALLSDAVDSNQPGVGALTLVYDHHLPNVTQNLIEIQHQADDMVVASTHVHLDAVYCLEVIILRGKSQAIRELSDRMISLRGVKHGKLVLTGAGEASKPHGHTH